MTNEEKIWQFLKSCGLNDYGAAGLMGNLYAESGLSPKNLQNTYEKKLGYTDDSYTDAVDSGAYSNFVNDSAGYGLAQWTYWSRKQALLTFCKASGASIGDLDMQLSFLIKELSDGYSGVLSTLKTHRPYLKHLTQCCSNLNGQLTKVNLFNQSELDMDKHTIPSSQELPRKE